MEDFNLVRNKQRLRKSQGRLIVCYLLLLVTLATDPASSPVPRDRLYEDFIFPSHHPPLALRARLQHTAV